MPTPTAARRVQSPRSMRSADRTAKCALPPQRKVPQQPRSPRYSVNLVKQPSAPDAATAMGNYAAQVLPNRLGPGRQARMLGGYFETFVVICQPEPASYHSSRPMAGLFPFGSSLTGTPTPIAPLCAAAKLCMDVVPPHPRPAWPPWARGRRPFGRRQRRNASVGTPAPH